MEWQQNFEFLFAGASKTLCVSLITPFTGEHRLFRTARMEKPLKPLSEKQICTYFTGRGLFDLNRVNEVFHLVSIFPFSGDLGLIFL
jgi:hypothetical protein